ncbi:MAG TPA: hypothetical protein VMN79_04155 [Casimicrobiaceae bacterium]|nr:hypothetical protein [Casimicrobiaceae bacterium]
MQWAALLLGLYVAMHLAVGGAIRTVTGRDASQVIAPGGSTGTPVAASAAAGRGRRESPPRGGKQSPERPERSRDCKLSLLIDSDCLFD